MASLSCGPQLTGFLLEYLLDVGQYRGVRVLWKTYGESRKHLQSSAQAVLGGCR